jgi:hypothetical protein
MSLDNCQRRRQTYRPGVHCHAPADLACRATSSCHRPSRNAGAGKYVSGRRQPVLRSRCHSGHHHSPSSSVQLPCRLSAQVGRTLAQYSITRGIASGYTPALTWLTMPVTRCSLPVPVITAAMETLLPFRRARTVAGTPNSRTLVTLTPLLSHATARSRRAGTSFGSQPQQGRQADRESANRDLSTLRPGSLPSRPGPHRLPKVSIGRVRARPVVGGRHRA